MGSVYEEKLSPKFPISLKPEMSKANQSKKEMSMEMVKDIDEKDEDLFLDDILLDEITAKTSAIMVEDGDEKLKSHAHDKCIDTVKGQGETISKLVEQLLEMCREYNNVNTELEYFKELNEALFQCLHMRRESLSMENDDQDEDEDDSDDDDGDDDDDDDECGDEDERDGYELTELDGNIVNGERCAVTTQTDEIASTLPSEEVAGNADSKRNCSPQGVDSMEKNESSENNGLDGGDVRKPRFIKRKELQRINEILLCEVFELRHQIKAMNDAVLPYLF